MKFFNRVAVTTETTGTGTLTFGIPLSGKMLSPAEAGAVDADETYYLIEDGTDFEIGIGTVGDDETTLSRDSVLVSKISGTAGTSKINLSGDAVVRMIEPAEFLNGFGDAAFKSTGTAAGTVAAGDDARFHSAVTLTGTPDYITLSGQQITRHEIDLTADVTGVLPAANLPDASTSAEGVVELATAAEYRTGTDSTRAVGVSEAWGSAALATLTDGSTIAVNFASGFNFGGASNAPLSLGGNRTLGAPSNVSKNQAGVLWFTASGSTRTLTLNAAWELSEGVETGPYSITTSQELGVAYVVRGSDITVTAIIRKAT